MKARFFICLFFLSILPIAGVVLQAQAQEEVANTPTVFTYRAPESELDIRYEYDNTLFKLALDKTVDEYGPYVLKASPAMNFKRAIYYVEKNKLPNFFIKQSYTDELAEKMHFVPVPVDRGIVGYRVFFVSKLNQYKLATVKTLDDLRALSIVQGAGWTDIEILEKNGFEVLTLDRYEDLFSFVAKGRADLFLRGANELLGEYQSYKNSEPLHQENLEYDDKFVLYYPLPRFFFTSKGNTKAAERVRRGLEIAWKDGSFQKLWEERYGKYLRELKIKERTIFEIENNLIHNLDESYKQYLFEP